MASIIKRGSKHCVVYPYISADGSTKQKWETFDTLAEAKQRKTVVEYENVTQDVYNFFNDMLKQCELFGIKKNQVCFDMGIGFGKSYEDNLDLIKNIKNIKIKDVALLTALSSKRVVANATDSANEDLVYGTISANSLAIQGGTDIIRVHNVRENVLAAKMCDAVLRR